MDTSFICFTGLVSFCCGIAAAFVLIRKKHDPVVAWGIGLFFGFLALIFALFIADDKQVSQRAPQSIAEINRWYLRRRRRLDRQHARLLSSLETYEFTGLDHLIKPGKVSRDE